MERLSVRLRDPGQVVQVLQDEGGVTLSCPSSCIILLNRYRLNSHADRIIQDNGQDNGQDDVTLLPEMSGTVAPPRKASVEKRPASESSSGATSKRGDAVHVWASKSLATSPEGCLNTSTLNSGRALAVESTAV